MYSSKLRAPTQVPTPLMLSKKALIAVQYKQKDIYTTIQIYLPTQHPIFVIQVCNHVTQEKIIGYLPSKEHTQACDIGQ